MASPHIKRHRAIKSRELNKCSHKECHQEEHIVCSHCLDHIDEHQKLMRDELDNLFKEANEKRNQLANLHLDNNRAQLYYTLKKWRLNSIEHIEQIYQEKLNELDNLFFKSGVEFEQFKTEQSQAIINAITLLGKQRAQQTTVCTADLDSVRHEIENFRRLIATLHTKHISIQFHSERFDYVRISEEKLDLADIDSDEIILFNQPAERIIPVNECDRCVMASSDTHIILSNTYALLVYEYSTGRHSSRIMWPTKTMGMVKDICFCSMINVFLVLSSTTLARYSITQGLIQIREILPMDQMNFDHITCTPNGECVFIVQSIGTYLDKILTKNGRFDLVKRYHRYELIEHDEKKKIGIIHASHTRLGLTVQQQQNNIRIDLFDLTSMEHLYRIEGDSDLTLLTSVHEDQWLIFNAKLQEFYWIDKECNSKIIKQATNYEILRACTIGTKRIVLMREFTGRIQLEIYAMS